MAKGQAPGGGDPGITVAALPITGLAADEGEGSSSGASSSKKDPRTIARGYQLELCKKALEENIIVYMGTGCGKTHIAVLLIHALGHLIRKPQKNICVFLAPTVALVQQQARVIEESIDFKVGTYCGNSRRLRTHHDWEKEFEQYEVFVMTPQILLRGLYHCFIRMELIALLIFDECHHAQVQSNHPYAEIMKVFYKTSSTRLPRIFGMTASPVVGKGASDQANLPKCINSLENLLHAKVYSVENQQELERFVASPKINVYCYHPDINMTSSTCKKLEEIKSQCVLSLRRNVEDHKSLRSTKKLLQRMHDNLIFSMENLGLWGALQASRILLSGDHAERNELMEAEGSASDDRLCDKYLDQSANVLASECIQDGIGSDISYVDVLKEPFFSRKLLRLIGILSTFRRQPNMKCIIFVNRIVTARSLAYILQNLKFLSYWKCDFLVGVHSGLKSMSRKTMNIILDKFRSNELNLLVATKVGEEGLDIQTCCLVIRFDLPETVASFIQSRGRARMPQSEYAFLVDSGKQKEIDLIEHFKKDEDRMNMEISVRTSSEAFTDLEERIYKVDSSGASISSVYSISLLHQYCSKLLHDEYFNPKPEFYYFDDSGGTVCQINLPSSAPIHQIVSTPQSSMEAAKKDACLKAIQDLHVLGALNDYLLPDQGNAHEELMLVSSDSDSCEDEDSREELHEMLVPAALKDSWSNLEHICLNSYYIKFTPIPEDRIYRKFGLFVKAPLPAEAERMVLDLHLSHGRSVMTELVPSGVTEFDENEILQAHNFQEMYLQVILNRSIFETEIVHLGKSDFCKSSSSTFYLLLPVILNECENMITVDWQIIRRCLSSPIFRNPADRVDKLPPLNDHLRLADGVYRESDVINSLVYAPYKKAFFFVSRISAGRNGYSPYKDSSHLEYTWKTFGIHLEFPKQPLLSAKRLFSLRNLLHNRKHGSSESHELEEHFMDIPPELCHLKIIGFSKDIGSSVSLLPSIMHRLENLLVAIELKNMLSASFPEGAEITAHRVLEALTTEKCLERFSLERLEVLGDAFLKFAVGRRLFLLYDALDEGELTRRRSNVVNNSNLFKLAVRRNLQVYIRDQSFDPGQFFALGHRCPRICEKETEMAIHSRCGKTPTTEVRCSKCHHWLHKKTIADVVEALVGAFIVDSGFKAATVFLKWIGIQVDFEAFQVINACISSTSYMQLASSTDVPALEKLLGHEFLHKGLLLQAIVHPSYNKHGGGCYQRLEFLGDAVLDYLITSYLYSVYPKLKPGQMTDLRSLSVNNKSFANVAVSRSLHEFLICDASSLSEAIKKYVDFIRTPTLDKDLHEGPKCPKALGDLVESCMGAILLDKGFDLNHAWNIMLSILDRIMSFSDLQLNPIRELQELCQHHNWDLQFPTSKQGGTFLVEAKVSGDDICTTASATNANRKDARRIASNQLFKKLKDQGYMLHSESLEEVLKSSSKMEAKLIGYDEKPIDVAFDSFEFEKLKMQEHSNSDCNRKIQPMKMKPKNVCSPCIKPVSDLPQFQIKASEQQPHEIVQGGVQKVSTKARMYEICAANYWKPPSFECCKEEGPSHLKLFTVKLTMKIEDGSGLLLECYGYPKSTKKAAADSAAEGAIAYLKQEGYFLPNSE
ncbi:hypothetical protein VitviT2T_016802 [Vitis vinifera]|uniref:Dicer-like protein 4 n=1 Tax=Vitis vinifera TaxID=29760 RepID=A0ABY9CRP4_VITVI|nr:dicer-like protein 4 [Vitis vinifera]WJZ98263.1 hypothetical protein VitviT2T_016802 [Vitis vinifera]|eukprot:XP_002264486.2 PREDICTED: dicer-like protein 4 isoform X2 [Vitis vinifera]